MGIIKKLDDKSIKIRWATENILQNPNSPIRCDYCGNRLGIGRMLRKSLWIKKGYEYIVICPNCRRANIRVKGQIGINIDKEWDDSVLSEKRK